MCVSPYYLISGKSTCLKHYYSTDRRYRLADGETVPVDGRRSSTGVRGRMEFFYQGAWGTVCDDKANDDTAKVFCRSVNLPYLDAERIREFGGGQGQILLGNVKCNGYESEISNCPRHEQIGLGSACKHEEDLGALCY